MTEPTQPVAATPPATRLVRVKLSASMQQTHTEVVVVPADISEDELRELGNMRYRVVGGGEYQMDENSWDSNAPEVRLLTQEDGGQPAPSVRVERSSQGDLIVRELPLSEAPFVAAMGELLPRAQQLREQADATKGALVEVLRTAMQELILPGQIIKLGRDERQKNRPPPWLVGLPKVVHGNARAASAFEVAGPVRVRMNAIYPDQANWECTAYPIRSDGTRGSGRANKARQGDALVIRGDVVYSGFDDTAETINRRLISVLQAAEQARSERLQRLGQLPQSDAVAAAYVQDDDAADDDQADAAGGLRPRQR